MALPMILGEDTIFTLEMYLFQTFGGGGLYKESTCDTPFSFF